MSLTPGAVFGPYQVLAKLGEGGMGEVYRAHDGKLNRDVAIKILPDAFAHDTDRVARFTREAQTLASLNHPNIAQIYGILEEPASPRSGPARACPRHGTGRGRGPVSAGRARGHPARRGAAHRQADCRRARGRARAGHHPSRPQAREHQGARRRHGQGAGLRSRQGGGSIQARSVARSGELTDHCLAGHDGDGHDPRHRRLHVAGAGERQERRQTRGHLGLRRGAARDAHRCVACSPATASPKRWRQC